MIENHRLARWCLLHRVPLLPQLLYTLNRSPSTEVARNYGMGIYADPDRHALQ